MNSKNFIVESTLSKKISEIRGFIFLQKKKINTYFLLEKENKSLIERNRELIHENFKLKHLIEEEKNNEIDSLNHTNITYQAKVVQNTWKKKQNHIIIRKNLESNVRKNMGVIEGNKLVGIVHSVSNNFATVISLLNTDLMISSKLKKTGHYGSMNWMGENFQEMLLLDIPKHAKIEIGDTIITSGYSNIFPEGIDIGTVKSYKVQENTNFYQIKVNLFVDFTNINYVYIIENSDKEERKIIEKNL